MPAYSTASVAARSPGVAARRSDGTSAFFLRQLLIKNVVDTVPLEGSVQMVDTDINPAGWTVPAITADDTN